MTQVRVLIQTGTALVMAKTLIRTILIGSTWIYKAPLVGLQGSNFQQCVAEQTNGVTTAGEVTRLDCGHRNIQTIAGIKNFPNLQVPT